MKLTVQDWQRVIDWELPVDWDEWTDEMKVSWAVMLRDMEDTRYGN